MAIGMRTFTRGRRFQVANLRLPLTAVAGKTFLACAPIHYLQEIVTHTPECSVVFAYCRYSEVVSVRDILAALLR